jgi:DNA helicase-2/ATP-dependent DNA helicase PcrA
MDGNQKMVFTPSIYQENIFEFIRNGKGHAVIEATAGSGKTTTLMEALKFIPSSLKVIYIAFNNSIVDEIKSKKLKNVEVCTTHSLGRTVLIRSGFKVDLKNDKSYQIFSAIVKDYNLSRHMFSSLSSFTIKLVGFLKNNNMEASNENINHLMEHHDITLPEYVLDDALESLKKENPKLSDDEILSIHKADIMMGESIDKSIVFSFVKNTLKKSFMNTKTIDYNDMIYLPVKHSKKMNYPKYDIILFDEAQDANKTQMELVLNCLSENGRIIAMGDKFQSLYGFRGADVDSIPNFIARMDATLLPLSITYRCPKNVVKLAQTLVPHIEAAENAIDGKVETINYTAFSDYVQSGDLVLCRNNAPLIKPCFTLISNGIKATINGRDIGAELVKFIKEFKTTSNDDLGNLISDWLDEEEERYKAKNLNPNALIDKCECIFTLIEMIESDSVNVLIKHIQNIFSENNDVEVLLSTVHRAKGLEAKNVFILYPHLMPSLYAKKDWELQQEQNIRYVAYTRPLENLYFVEE